jgi:CBS domain-containing protein
LQRVLIARYYEIIPNGMSLANFSCIKQAPAWKRCVVIYKRASFTLDAPDDPTNKSTTLAKNKKAISSVQTVNRPLIFRYEQGERMLVKDIVEPIGANWLSPEMALSEAVCRMERTRREGDGGAVSGMVVLEDSRRLVGVLSVTNVIRAVIPSYLVLDENLGGLTWNGMIEERMAKARDRKVKDVMSASVMTITPEASLMRCADMMIEHHLDRLPVVNDGGEVVGVVHLRDLYRTLTDLMCQSEGDDNGA